MARKIQIKDIWYKDRYKNQPGIYTELGLAVDTTIYSVFLDQTYPDMNYYTIKAPFIGGATTDNIYVFDHWSGTGVNLISQNSRETAVEFINQNNMQLTAHYVPVLNRANYTLIVPEDEFLEVPEGANYTFPSGFTIKCYGDFNITGTSDHQVVFSGPGKNSGYQPDYDSPSDTLIILKGIGSYAYYNFVKFNDLPCAIQVDAPKAKLKIKHCTFENNNVSVLVGELNNTSILLDSLVFKNNDVGIQFAGKILDIDQTSRLAIAYSIFENEKYYDIYGWPQQELSASPKLYVSIINNDFINNSYSAIYIRQVGSVNNGFMEFDVFNNIFYQSSCNLGPYSVRSGSNLFYNVSSPPNWSGNIIGDPQFIDVNTSNYYLHINSPAIDAATLISEGDLRGYPDYYTEEDIDNTLPEVGKYFYPQLYDTLKSDFEFSGEGKIIDDLVIPDSIQLIINPGSTVKIEKDATIYVYGKLQSKGTDEQKIVFTSIYDAPSESDYWDRIYFKDESNDSSFIDNSIIKYSKYGVYIYKANVDVSNSHFGPNKTYGIFLYRGYSEITDNLIHDSYYGVRLQMCNDYGESIIKNNNIYNAQRGIYLYKSSPKILNNEIYDNTYGIYCSYYSSPNLGYLGVFGENNIHNNNYGIKAYKSSPFLGRDMCSFNGGNNIVSGNSDYNIYAYSNSIITAHRNWWGSSPPNSSLIYSSSDSDVDYSNYLESPPLFKLSKSSGFLSESSLFDLAFTQEDSSLSEADVMESYNPSWPIMRRILFSRTLISLGFPANASDICNDILRSYPDSLESYLALDILWQAGRGNTPEFETYRIRLDSLSSLNQEIEIYEEAELLSEDYASDENVKKSFNSYTKYHSPKVASLYLLEAINEYLLAEDFVSAKSVYDLMLHNFPEAPATLEASLLIDEVNLFSISDKILPNKYLLYPNYPNPFNPLTHFRFGLPNTSDVEIFIYNVLGQRVKTLKAYNLLAGYHILTWDGKNKTGVNLASGMYFYKFNVYDSKDKSIKFTKSGKMLMLK